MAAIRCKGAFVWRGYKHPLFGYFYYRYRQRIEARGLETKIEPWRPDQVGRLLVDNGVREEAILRGRLIPLEAFAGGVGDRVAFAREVGERIARVALC